jgi:malate synthase
LANIRETLLRKSLFKEFSHLAKIRWIIDFYSYICIKLKDMSELTRTMEGVEINGELKSGYDEILTPEAIAFVVKLHRSFNGKRKDLLDARQGRQAEIDNGNFPDFLPETAHIRESEWTVAPLPEDLLDRRVEITGPVDRKMVSMP